MAVSTTQKKCHKKFNKKLFAKATQQATTETVEQLLLGLISAWSARELDRMSSSRDQFVCLALGKDFYRVGRFNLEKQKNDDWQVSDLDGCLVHNFYSQHAAVFYCLFETKKVFHKAKEFIQCDQAVYKAQLEVTYLREKLQKAVQKKDFFSADVFRARLSDMLPKLEALQTNLQKTLNGAKYTKVWETKS